MKTVPFYRLVKSVYAGSAFDGFGARTYGGRWNSIGVPCVYLASSRALCALELLVHLSVADLSQRYAMLSLEIPQELIAELDKAALPPDWQSDPAPRSNKALGDGWLSDPDNGLVLKVPSTLTGEWNALYNPQHPAALDALKTVKVEPFFFDARFALK